MLGGLDRTNKLHKRAKPLRVPAGNVSPWRDR